MMPGNLSRLMRTSRRSRLLTLSCEKSLRPAFFSSATTPSRPGARPPSPGGALRSLPTTRTRPLLSTHGLLRDSSFSSSSSQDASRVMYNEQATRWARTEPRLVSDFTGRPVVFGMLAEVLGKGRGGIVLDVGCGEGYCARKAVELGATKIVGCDISSEMISCSKSASGDDDRFHYYACPAGELSSGLRERCSEIGIDNPDERAFDVAMAVFLFNYLNTDDMEDVMSQIYAALKPGGTFVFSVPHPSMIFCHDSDSAFHLDSKGRGYYSSRNQMVLGKMSTLDGTRLNIMSVHKTLGDYIAAINRVGYRIADVQEAGVTEEHMALHPEFFESVKDRPLHLVFNLKRPDG